MVASFRNSKQKWFCGIDCMVGMLGTWGRDSSLRNELFMQINLAEYFLSLRTNYG